MKGLILSLPLLLLLHQARADEAGEKFWFQNSFSCAGREYVIRNYCSVDANRTVNRPCDSQQLVIQKNGMKSTVSLNTHQPDDDMLWVSAVRCGSEGRKQFLYMLFDNGGNCDQCEVEATMDSNGRWIQFGDKWFTDRRSKKRILLAQHKWFKTPAYLIKNKDLDTQQ